jgi:hypothetical protein
MVCWVHCPDLASDDGANGAGSVCVGITNAAHVRPSWRADGDPGITEPLIVHRDCVRLWLKSREDEKLLCARIVDTPRRNIVCPFWFNPLCCCYGL